jgi:hypothetical protein
VLSVSLRYILYFSPCLVSLRPTYVTTSIEPSTLGEQQCTILTSSAKEIVACFNSVSNSLTDYQHASSSRTAQLHLCSSSTITGTDRSQPFSSLDTNNSMAVYQNNQLSRVDVDLGFSTIIRAGEIVLSSESSHSSIVDRKYRYALFLWMEHLYHANSSPILESSRATACTCLSELVSASDGVPRLTSDGYTHLVICVIECIAAHQPIGSDSQHERQQTLDFDSEG